MLILLDGFKEKFIGFSLSSHSIDPIAGRFELLLQQRYLGTIALSISPTLFLTVPHSSQGVIGRNAGFMVGQLSPPSSQPRPSAAITIPQGVALLSTVVHTKNVDRVGYAE
jgi:hypothetical protein